MFYLCCTCPFFRFDFKQKKAEDFSSAFVQVGRLELPHLAAPDPKSSVHLPKQEQSHSFPIV